MDVQQLIAGAFSVGDLVTGGIDLGDTLHWLELRQVDGTLTVYIEAGSVFGVPNNPRNNCVASVIAYKDNRPFIVMADNQPTKSEELILRAALGYAQQVASTVSSKGESVTIRRACGKHNDYHKIATIRCTRTEREKIKKDVDLTEQFTVILHPYHG